MDVIFFRNNSKKYFEIIKYWYNKNIYIDI